MQLLGTLSVTTDLRFKGDTNIGGGLLFTYKYLSLAPALPRLCPSATTMGLFIMCRINADHIFYHSYLSTFTHDHLLLAEMCSTSHFPANQTANNGQQRQWMENRTEKFSIYIFKWKKRVYTNSCVDMGSVILATNEDYDSH